MELSMKKDDSRVRFVIQGNIDEVGAEEMKLRFRELNLNAIDEVVFDFSGVNHIGSAGIGKLLLFYKDLAITGGSLKIENTNETVFELLTVLKLDTIFTISRS